ncbi:MAG: DNA/RNA non-specific endonuclease [Methylococcaceae bacterium]|nr:DNA/RNA non-specific endonuclease [Methylococcaceae bacterium]
MHDDSNPPEFALTGLDLPVQPRGKPLSPLWFSGNGTKGGSPSARFAALVSLLIIGAGAQAQTPTHSLRVDYEGFSVWLDCDQHGAYRFAYSVGFDTGDEPRADHFSLDPGVPAHCQPASAGSFKAPPGKPRFDRGHQVPANHMDWSSLAIGDTNYMTNILPQTAVLNRGAWLATEEIIECYRDVQDLRVVGGAIWGNNAHNDYFVESHGIKTPDYFWKVVIRADGKAQAWLFPNSNAPTRARLNKYLISIASLEKKLGESFPVSEAVRKKRYSKSWTIPAGCDKG